MKLYYMIFSLVTIILFSGCSSKQEQLIVAETIVNFNVDKNAMLIDEKIQNKSPFRTKIYKVPVQDISGEAAGMINITIDSIKVEFQDIDKDGQIIAVTSNVQDIVYKGYHKYELFAPSLQLLMIELQERGHKYFQIIEPYTLSNARGYPINNIANLTTYLAPAINDPADDMELKNGKTTHNSVSQAFTMAGTTTFKFTIIIIDKPKPYQIVWDVKDNL